MCSSPPHYILQHGFVHRLFGVIPVPQEQAALAVSVDVLIRLHCDLTSCLIAAAMSVLGKAVAERRHPGREHVEHIKPIQSHHSILKGKGG